MIQSGIGPLLESTSFISDVLKDMWSEIRHLAEGMYGCSSPLKIPILVAGFGKAQWAFDFNFSALRKSCMICTRPVKKLGGKSIILSAQ